MRRRLRLVPLTFVPPKPDKALVDALREELPGILAWATRGCIAWQREGLNPPDVVRRACHEYFAEQDIIGNWFAKRCGALRVCPQARGSECADDAGGFAPRCATRPGSRSPPPGASDHCPQQCRGAAGRRSAGSVLTGAGPTVSNTDGLVHRAGRRPGAATPLADRGPRSP